MLFLVAPSGQGLAESPPGSPPSPFPSPVTTIAVMRSVQGTGIAGCGAIAAGIGAAAQTAAEFAAGHVASLGVHESALEAAHHDATAARAVIVDGGASPERRHAQVVADGQLAQALGARSAALTGIRAALEIELVNQIGPEGLSLLHHMQANTNRPVPDHFKCLELSDEGWQVLQVALRRSEQALPLSPAESTALSDANSTALVHAVAQRIATNGPALEAWFAGHAHAAAVNASGPTQ